MNEQIIITSADPIQIRGVNHKQGNISIVCTPSGSGNYSVAFTCSPGNLAEASKKYAPITDMTTATTLQVAELGPVTGLKITLHSGTNVTVDIAQAVNQWRF